MKIGIGLGLAQRLGGGGAAPDTSPLLVIVTGQSNAERMFSTVDSAPAASAGTYYHNGAILTTVPLANGCRELANELKALFPLRDIHLAEAATSGSVSGYFISGQGGWTDFSAKYTALGGVDLVICQQGEGDSAAGTSAATTASATKETWKSNWRTVSTQINTLAGATVPVLFIGLSTFGDTQAINADDQWSAVQAGIKELCDEQAHIYYSHPMIDAVRSDTYHYNGASYGKSGKRSAAAAGAVLGAGGTIPAWFITGATVVSATETDVTVAHSDGTDFTPTTGITGFSISNNNGATWETPSAAVRQSATSIRLMHSDFGTAVDREARYMYGTLPDITGVVLDNSTLTAPLAPSAGIDLIANGSGGYPVPKYLGVYNVNTGGATPSFTGVAIGADTAAEETMVAVIALNQGAVTLNSATLTPSGGSAITGTILDQQTTTDHASIVRFIVPAGTPGLSSATLLLTYGANPFSRSYAAFWTVPTSRLLSTTPVDTDKSSSAAATSRTLQLSSTVNGLTIAAVISSASTSFTWTGDDTLVERRDFVLTGTVGVADASNTIAGTNDNEVTVTAAGSGSITLIAATFR